ncbi:PLD nuclease N-terminal domain-containing protein [Cryobacterium sp. SO2]|uniref:PLD nuclease N-terminal domain-containing protein n=1 Tax=Cryobacterium sp. SO2 TaxID=1897060 RepID=UPI00223D323D|nr:PLD nuclease N-terminal domain-containing protein [Cryobacterium sp. SO2]WEO77716.1 PLD nuclease N-terminal domain-containing protein [Cryobacterium sp. SO2]
MFRLLFGLGVVVVILTIYTLVDCAVFDRNRIRGVPRWVWIFVIILIPVIGPVLWLLIGRGRRGNAGPAGGRVMRSMAPDDDPDFLRGLDRVKDQDQRIRDLEKELADFDKTDPEDDGPGRSGTAGVDPKKTDPGEGDQPGRRDA